MSTNGTTSEKERYQAYLAGREWGLLKRQVKARSGGICERCKINPSDAVHHLTYERKYREQLEDLQDICEACHNFTHGKSDFDPLKQSLLNAIAKAMITARNPALPPWQFLLLARALFEIGLIEPTCDDCESRDDLAFVQPIGPRETEGSVICFKCYMARVVRGANELANTRS